MTQYGLTPQGFVTMRQSDCLTALQAAFRAAFGATTNLSDETVLGQIAGIMSEREALLWEALDDTVASATPGGAEGIFVDNLLAYSGLQRLTASATKTNPTPSAQGDGRVLNGLVLYGTPGTVIPAGAILQTSTQPTYSFTLDAPVTINAAANALQRIFFSNTPTTGTYALGLAVPSGGEQATAAIPFNAQAQATVLTFPQPPTSGTYVLSLGQTGTVPLAYNAGALDIQSAIQAIPAYASAGVSGTLAAGYTITWPAGPIPAVAVSSVRVMPSGAPSGGTFALKLGALTTGPLSSAATAANVQTAVNALAGYQAVGVTGSFAAGYVLHFGLTAVPTVTVANSVSGVTFAVSPTNTLDKPLNIVNSVQAYINAVLDLGTGQWPFTDVLVTSPTSGQFACQFGGTSPMQGQPSSGAQAQGLMTVASNSLLNGGTSTNLAVVNAVMGAPAQAVGSATCTETGPKAVPAGTLTVIGSGQTGFAGVTNQLDCLSGRDLETDSEAMDRRAAQLSASGSGPLAATVQRVEGVANVTAALGFANTTAAALQRLAFATAPTSGGFQLGSGSSIAAFLPFNATAAALQNALAALPGLSAVQVSGTAQYGYTVDFNGSGGGQAMPLLSIVQDTTGAQLAATFGRPPKSIEVVVEGGDDTAIASSILGASAGGIATYGAPVLLTTGSCTAGSTALVLASVSNVAIGMAVFAQGLRAGSVVVGLSGNTVTLSLPALSTSSQVSVTVNHTVFLTDGSGNPQQVSFSRPQSILIYVNVVLTTDLYSTPGDPTSGANAGAKFSAASVAQIQADLIAIGNAIPIGGLIVARGTSGLVGAFNDVPGIVDYSLTFDSQANPTQGANIRMQAEQVPLFSTFTTQVSFA